MTNSTLIEKLSNIQVAYTDPILASAAKRLHAGEDAEKVVVETLEQLATDRDRLLKELIALQVKIAVPGRVEIVLGKDGAPPSKEIDALVQASKQGKPLTEVFGFEKPENPETKG